MIILFSLKRQGRPGDVTKKCFFMFSEVATGGVP